jgi:thiosulfate/3-mercaptopyruvate sulfurtransferase
LRSSAKGIGYCPIQLRRVSWFREQNPAKRRPQLHLLLLLYVCAFWRGQARHLTRIQPEFTTPTARNEWPVGFLFSLETLPSTDLKRDKETAMADYKHPEVLVSTEWAANNLQSPNVRLVEVDVDTSAYDQGHIPGAVGWNWQTQLQDNVRRDLIEKNALEKLLGDSGISNDTTILLYGDNNNWFAAYAFWQLKYNGHKDVRLINGGRKKWLEEKRPVTTEASKVAPATYRVGATDESIRARRDEVFGVVDGKKRGQLVDVRSVDEFTGKILAPPGLSETAQRAGHIPGAANIPWAQAANEDGTFKSADALATLYQGKGVNGKDEVIAYCRIGERSSHTWFVLKYLLGYDNVRNYDGSWTEWGNLIGAPVTNQTVSGAAATAGAK